MAEREGGNHNGRMLFTDLDVSSKGRPASAPALDDGEAYGFMPSRLPTIADIALNLELDFEDDWDEEGALPDRNDADTRAGTGMDQPAASRRRTSARTRRPTAAPARRREIQPDDPLLLPPDDASGDQPAVEAPAPAPDSVHPPEPDDKLPRPDYSTPEEDAAAAVLPIAGAGDDDDFDILSILPALFSDAGELPERDSGGLGVRPPPAVPYGGIERVEDWFQPPEPLTAPMARDGVDAARAHTDLITTDGQSRKETDSATDQPHRPAGQRQETSGTDVGSRFVDLFSGFDVDAAWHEKVALRQAGPTLASGDAPEMFASVDLEREWLERRNRRRRAVQPGEPDPRDPRYRSPEAANAQDTAILDMEDVMASLPAEARGERDTERIGGGGSSTLLRPVNLVQPGAAQSRAKNTGLTAPAAAAARSAAAVDIVSQFSLDDLDLDSLFLDDDPAPAVQAPSISDADITQIAEEASEAPRRSKKAKPAPSSENVADEPDYMPGSPAMAVKSAQAEPVLAVGEENAVRPEEAIGTGREGDNAGGDAGRRSIADTLLADIDLDGLEEGNDHVAAPVIDDSAIDPSFPLQSMTDEMEAIAAEGEETAADSVTVDPMAAFANLDDMDFSGDGLDDDMQALLDDDGDTVEDETGADAMAADPPNSAERTLRVRLQARLLRVAGRVAASGWMKRLRELIGWQENWWFYCDLLAAVIASASLAVILSYHIWYKK